MLNNGVGSWPARRARMTPDGVAFIHDGRPTTFAALDDRVNRLAHGLRSLGVGPGDRVAYLGPNHPAFMETLFAAAALGSVFVPLNTRLSARELGYMLGDSGATVLVWSSEQADVVSDLQDQLTLAHLIAVDGQTPGSAGPHYEQLLDDSPVEAVDVAITLDDICMIMYTSGTTGTPKGAMLTHGNVTWNCYNLLIDLDVSSDEVALITAPMFHTAALNQTVLPTFLKGGTSVLVSKFDPTQFFDLVTRHRISMMFGVPAMFQSIALSPVWPTADLSSLRILQCGGAPVPEALIRVYQDRGLTFVQGYGMTEAAPGMLLLRPQESTRKIGSAGTPCFFTDTRVVRPDMTGTDPGEAGEIVVQGPNVMKGYWQRPEDTARAVTDGWLHSGDVGIVDDDGFVFVVDRIKDMIISGGENVYPAEVEKVLYEHPAVQECAVIGVPDERWGEVGRAIVVLKDGVQIEPQDLLEFLDGKLARYKIPKTVVTVDQLSRNAVGKLQRKELKQAYADRRT